MMKNINCKWNDQGAWCKNKNIKRNLFGIGARCCIEHGENAMCSFKDFRPKPRHSPPPPPPTPNPKIRKNEFHFKCARS